VVSAGRDRTLAAPATRRVARDLGVDLNDVPAVEEREEGAFVDEAAVRAYAEARDSGPASGFDTDSDSDGADAETGIDADADADAGTDPGPDVPDPRTPSLSDAEPAVSTAAGDPGTARAPSEPAPGAGDAPDEGSAAVGSADAGADADVPPPETADRTDPDAVTGERIPYRGVRRATGEAMQRSAFTAPHVTHTDVADAEPLVDLRTELKPLAAERDVTLTYLPFVMKACVVALQEYPVVNAILDEEAGEIVLRDDYHVGVATATEAGLLVPVVRDVDRKGLATIAADTNDLVARARDRSIDREALRGSTFTVTNVGTIGGEFATPILNAPEAAILALGAIKQRPHVVDGEVVARHTLPLSLSFDHRVFDGATAAEFTNRVIDLLEEPRNLLL
jgi:pyruvate dehydrogenase E2 component (dihydrolipoamide acetyltransferase)